jgi:hypothetical protein
MSGEVAALRAANAGLRQVIEAKDVEITALLTELGAVKAQVADLAARVKANSKNSSRPPTSDGLRSWRRSRCARRPAAGRAGRRGSRGRRWS